jgi:hypothetical protein
MLRRESGDLRQDAGGPRSGPGSLAYTPRSIGPTTATRSNQNRPLLFSRKYSRRLAGFTGLSVENG